MLLMQVFGFQPVFLFFLLPQALDEDHLLPEFVVSLEDFAVPAVADCSTISFSQSLKAAVIVPWVPWHG